MYTARRYGVSRYYCWGGIQGGAGESSSFKHGLFHEICLEYEMILGNGERVLTSTSQNADLFEGTACSYGSIGIITLAKIRLIPASPFVRLQYRRARSAEEACRISDELIETNTDFVDSILFAKDRGVVMAGVFSEKVDLPMSQFSRRSDEWFYLHADRISRTHEVYEELVPLRDYLFRYDRGAFWMGKYGFDLVYMPFTKFTRWMFDFALHTRELYRSLHAANISQRYLIQDLGLPRENAAEFIAYIGEKLGIYPLWFIPLKVSPQTLAMNHVVGDRVISVGVWGYIGKDGARAVEINREVEREVTRLGGRKWLYAHQYYSPEEFWKIYDRAWYENIRKKYGAETAFPDVYEKTMVSGKYTASVTRGIIRNFIHSARRFISDRK